MTTQGTSDLSLLDQVLGDQPPPFALLYRPSRCDGTAGNGLAGVEVLVGTTGDFDNLADIPLPDIPLPGVPSDGTPGHDALVLVPFRQIRERGFAHHDDGTPLTCLRITGETAVTVDEVRRRIPDTPVVTRDGGFDVDDETYAAIVKTVVTDEIGAGEGANFVIHRTWTALVEDFSPRVALTLFRRLLDTETGAYWTFVVHTGDRILVGATPERHVSARNGTVLMNPISGTYRYPATGPDREGLLAFLDDPKETDELFMVVDEELKMMSTVGVGAGGRVLGPYLKKMAHLAHTEYVLEGHSSLDARDILRETMFAATVTGSPVENACRIIARHEPYGRGYYAGMLALIGRGADGGRTLDAPILIRTLDIDPAGRLRLAVGATLVRHSRPEAEVAETYAKAAGVLAALGVDRSAGQEAAECRVAGQGGTGPPAATRLSRPARPAATPMAEDPEVQARLRSRNVRLAPFWLSRREDTEPRSPEAVRGRVLVVDAEDRFTAMLAHMLRTLGLDVTVVPYDRLTSTADADLVVVGPGPGDPRDPASPKIATLRTLIGDLLRDERPLLAVCLGHQVLAMALGLPVIRKVTPWQGLQREIGLFGRREQVGFYNTFAAALGVPDASDASVTLPPGVEMSRDPVSGEVYALSGSHFVGLQFHPESVLTVRGIDILRTALDRLLGDRAPGV